MNSLERKRRSFLSRLGGWASAGFCSTARPASQGYVPGATDGKAGSATNSDHFALGTLQVTVGAGIPIHRHLQADEAFYVR